jgi:membrane fusion protein, multidrug efflux system
MVNRRRAALWGGAALATLLNASVTQAERLEARAVIKPLDRAILSGELAARVKSLPKRTGESFKKGDLLVGLDCVLYQAQAEKVAAENKAAEIKVQNTRKLNELRSVGALEVALAQSEYEQTAAELKIARLNTQRCEIKAPYDGKVVKLFTNRHETIQPQQELIEVVADQRLETEIVVPATWLRWLTPNTELQMQVDETGTHHTAQVEAISPAVDSVSQTVQLRARISDSNKLMPGMSATAYFADPVVNP